MKDCGLWGEYLDRRNKMMERYASKLSVLKDSTEDIKGNYEEPQQKAKQALGRAELELRQAQAEKETGRPRAKASELERSEAPRTIRYVSLPSHVFFSMRFDRVSMDRSQRDRGAGIEPTLQPQGNGKEWYSQHSQGAAPQPKRNGEGSLLYEDDDPIIVAPLRPQKDKALIGSHENRPTTRTEQNENSPTRNNKSKLATILGKKGKTLASQDVLKNEPAPVPERTKNASMRAIQKEPVEVLELDNEPPISRSQSILATISKNDGKASTRDNHMDPTPIPEQNGKASDRYNQIDPTMQAENCEIRTSNNENKRAPERGEYRKAPSSYGKYKPTPITKKYGEAPPSPNQSNAPPAHQARPFTSSSKTPSTTASRQNEPSLSMQKSKASTAYTPHEPERKEEGSKASDRKLNRSDQHTIPGQKGQASNTSDKKSNTPASGPPQIGKAPKSYVQIKNLNPDLNTAPAAAAPMKSRLRDFLRG